MLDQGTAHRDASGGNGFEGAARDPLQHALPLLHTAPGKVASVIRFTLFETYPVHVVRFRSAAATRTRDRAGAGAGTSARGHPRAHTGTHTGTHLGAVCNLSARNMPCELIGNGAPGPDGSPPFAGYNHPRRTSDLEVYLL